MSKSNKKSRKRWLVLLLLVAAIIAAFFLLRCTGTFGLGGGGDESDPTETETKTTDTTPRGALSSSDAAPAPSECLVQVNPDGMSVDGKPAELAAIVAACKRAGTARLQATGDLKLGSFEDVEKALHAAGVEVFKKE